MSHAEARVSMPDRKGKVPDESRESMPDWKGKVLDENGMAMPYANVLLLSLPDSSVVDGTVCDGNGGFFLKSRQGEEILMVSMVGYETVFFSGEGDLTVTMRPAAEMLGGAGVKAYMPKTRLTGEGLSTAVKGTVLENIGSAKDALARVPGVYSGRDGLEVIGKGKPVIYVNGRRLQDESELDRMRSNEIRSIEVIENPGASYDSSFGSVIRIRTFRPQGEGVGLNAGLSDAQSLDRKDFNDPGAFAKVNYRNGGLDIFAGVDGKVSHESQYSHLRTEMVTAPYMMQTGVMDVSSESRSFSVDGGLNYMIGNDHSMGFRVEYYKMPFLENRMILTEDSFRDGIFEENIHSVGDNVMDRDRYAYNVSANAYYNGTFGGKLNVDFNADYFGSNSTRATSTIEQSTAAPDVVIASESISGGDIYAAKLVLTYPLWTGRLQAGTEDSYTVRDNRYSITETFSLPWLMPEA